jgi:hypothetical protein
LTLYLLIFSKNGKIWKTFGEILENGLDFEKIVFGLFLKIPENGLFVLENIEFAENTDFLLSI